MAEIIHFKIITNILQNEKSFDNRMKNEFYIRRT